TSSEQSFEGYRFNQVVNDIHIKSLQREFGIGGNDNDKGRMDECAEEIKTGQFGHLYIKENQIRVKGKSKIVCLNYIFGDPDDLEKIDALQFLFDPFSRQRFVINDNTSQFHGS